MDRTAMSSATTATSFAAMTTPFVQAASCADLWSTSTIVTRGAGRNSTSVTLPILVSDTTNPRFATCRPPGMNKTAPEDHLTFSPAVCPSGWTGYQLSLRSTALSVLQPSTSVSLYTFTTAQCCAPGFTLGWSGAPGYPDDLPNSVSTRISPACWKVPPRTLSSSTATTTRSDEAVPTADAAGIPRVHKAWQIMWAPTDASTLSPPPPQICSTSGWGMASWVPSDPPPTQTCQPSESGPSWDSLIILVAVPPAVCFVLIVACCFFCCRRWRRKRRATRFGMGQPQMQTQEKGRETSYAKTTTGDGAAGAAAT
ncbi:hypothetical protein RB594_006000 [Gaeumannomyces avenae]